jgi:hypothetical protein
MCLGDQSAGGTGWMAGGQMNHSESAVSTPVRDPGEVMRSVIAPERHLVVLIEDGRKQGIFSPIYGELIHRGPLQREAILIKDGEHQRQARHDRYGPTRCIPTLHEDVLIVTRGAS